MIHKRRKLVACLALLLAAFAQALVYGQTGTTDSVFNRRFIPKIRPGMTYEQVLKLAGGPGLKTLEGGKASPSTVQYRWKGGRNSVLTANFANDKMTDASVLAPNGHTYLIKGNGEVIDTK